MSENLGLPLIDLETVRRVNATDQRAVALARGRSYKAEPRSPEGSNRVALAAHLKARGELAVGAIVRVSLYFPLNFPGRDRSAGRNRVYTNSTSDLQGLDQAIARLHMEVALEGRVFA